MYPRAETRTSIAPRELPYVSRSWRITGPDHGIGNYDGRLDHTRKSRDARIHGDRSRAHLHGGSLDRDVARRHDGDAAGIECGGIAVGVLDLNRSRAVFERDLLAARSFQDHGFMALCVIER